MDGGAPERTMDGLLCELARRLAMSGPEGRLQSAFLATVSHVHALITELGPTSEELRSVIEFLTDVGHSADARRQEWVLLADVIGVSTLVEDANSCRPRGATPNTLAGPFYRQDVPEVANGSTLSRDGVGAAMRIQGAVCDLDGMPIPSAMVEVWQANAMGRYENQDPDIQPEFNLRGRIQTDPQGQFRILTIKPKGYALPEDGPVGRLLNALGLRLERPAHVHFRVTAAGFETLTTHVFDRADPVIDQDALFGVKPELLADFTACPASPGGPSFALDVRFVLVRTGHAGKSTTPTRNMKG